MFTFGQASQFSRLVHEARIRYRRWCPTCGCENIRWAGCDDPYHDDRDAADIGNPNACETPPETPVRVRVMGDIDDPGDACHAPGSDGSNLSRRLSPHE